MTLVIAPHSTKASKNFHRHLILKPHERQNAPQSEKRNLSAVVEEEEGYEKRPCLSRRLFAILQFLINTATLGKSGKSFPRFLFHKGKRMGVTFEDSVPKLQPVVKGMSLHTCRLNAPTTTTFRDARTKLCISHAHLAVTQPVAICRDKIPLFSCSQMVRCVLCRKVHDDARQRA